MKEATGPGAKSGPHKQIQVISWARYGYRDTGYPMS